MLKVDDREPDKLFKILDKLEVAYTKERLLVGDLVLEEKSLCIERKEMGDFYNSICGDHMWNQALNMRENFQNNYVIISGDVKGMFFQNPQFNIHVYLGGMASLASKYGINVLKVDNDTQLVKLAVKLCEKTGEAPTHGIKRIGVSSESIKVSMMSCVPGISTTKAQKIMTHFNGDILKALLSTEKELEQIEGIGPKLAKNITGVVRNESKNKDGIQPSDSRESSTDSETAQELG